MHGQVVMWAAQPCDLLFTFTDRTILPDHDIIGLLSTRRSRECVSELLRGVRRPMWPRARVCGEGQLQLLLGHGRLPVVREHRLRRGRYLMRGRR